MRAEWHARVAEALDNYGMGGCPTRLLAISENATYAVEGGHGAVLRINRPGFRTRSQIESEIAWVEALREDGVLHTPRTIRDTDGRLVTRLPGGGEDSGCAVMMVHERGSTAESAGPEIFDTLGDLSARMHRHGVRFRARTTVDRPTFSLEDILGSRSPYGHWGDSTTLGADDRAVLQAIEDRAVERVSRRPLQSGLIHGDMRAANLLVDGDHLTVIDFDDCGEGWLLYELACAVSFIEADARTPERIEHWLRAYLAQTPSVRDDLDQLPDLIMLRRLLLIAWLATRDVTAEAVALAADFVHESVRLGREYLAGRYLRDTLLLLKGPAS